MKLIIQMQNQTKKNNLQAINGILLLDKPIDCTSNFILQRVKYLFQAKKAGHTGSLDPLATGMLPICFGEATKFSEFLLNADKCYEVTAQLGITTNTGDSKGEVITQSEVLNISENKLSEVISSFVGVIEQVPPMFSALKYKGQPLYKYARSGIDIDRRARTVNICGINLLSFATSTFKLRVVCSKGTYIRTLIEDIGSELGCGAHVVQLRRIHTSGFENMKMFSFSELQSMQPSEYKDCLLPVDAAVKHLPKLDIDSQHVKDLYNGKVVRDIDLNNYPSGIVRLYDSVHQTFVGIGNIVDGKALQVNRLLGTSSLGG